MTPSRRVVCQIEIAGTKMELGPNADLHLAMTGQIDHVLASRRHMPLVDVAGLEFSDVHIDFFKVRFAVRSSVNACDFHECASFRKLWVDRDGGYLNRNDASV
jgi:hypothetical protein